MAIGARIRAAACLTVLCGFPSNAGADPISFLYSVTVTSFFKNDVYQQVNKSFDLVATFDDQVTSVEDGPGFGAERYGAVRFSAIPLSVPKPYSDRPLEDDSFGSQHNFASYGVGLFYHQGALATQHFQRNSPHQGAYSRSVVLFAFEEDLAAAPDLTPRSLGAVVGIHPLGGGDDSGPPDDFEFDVRRFDLETGELAEWFLYRGSADFKGEVDSTEPVPEPGTLLLFATGAAAIGRRGWGRFRNFKANA